MVFLEKDCTEGHKIGSLGRRTHQSRLLHVPFLWEEFALMFEKGQWGFLSYSLAKEIPRLILIPPGVKEERY